MKYGTLNDIHSILKLEFDFVSTLVIHSYIYRINKAISALTLLWFVLFIGAHIFSFNRNIALRNWNYTHNFERIFLNSILIADLLSI